MPSHTTRHTVRPDVTLCLTIGKRPQELQRTLQSLFQHAHFEQVIAINDFGDEDTNAVFRQQCPHGRLISLGYNQGHHRAIDTMYREVTTPYVMHCEDDWEFDAAPDFDAIIEQLDNHPELTAVVLRKISDLPLTDNDLNKIEILHQPPAISHQPSAISHQPSAISHQPSAISHQPSAISHQPSAILLNYSASINYTISGMDLHLIRILPKQPSGKA